MPYILYAVYYLPKIKEGSWLVDVNKIRNVAVIAHGGAGKNILTEAMLFNSGSVDRLGRIEEGNTTTDCEPEEISRKITITSAFGFCNWDSHRINLIDTPGFINFVEDTVEASRLLTELSL